jgi:hypothetical protein
MERHQNLTAENLVGLTSWNVSPEAGIIANSFDELNKLLTRADRGVYNTGERVAKKALENIHHHFTILHDHHAISNELFNDWVDTYTNTHVFKDYVANIQTVGLFYKDSVIAANKHFNSNLQGGRRRPKKLTRRQRSSRHTKPRRC